MKNEDFQAALNTLREACAERIRTAGFAQALKDINEEWEAERRRRPRANLEPPDDNPWYTILQPALIAAVNHGICEVTVEVRAEVAKMRILVRKTGHVSFGEWEPAPFLVPEVDARFMAHLEQQAGRR